MHPAEKNRKQLIKLIPASISMEVRKGITSEVAALAAAISATQVIA
jgi:hypothetical protein